MKYPFSSYFFLMIFLTCLSILRLVFFFLKLLTRYGFKFLYWLIQHLNLCCSIYWIKNNESITQATKKAASGAVGTHNNNLGGVLDVSVQEAMTSDRFEAMLSLQSRD
jgi:hypothetical protein